LEASTLPGNPQTPLQLITQEIPLEPALTSFPVQETRMEVSVNIYISFPLNKPSLIQQIFLFRTRPHHHQALYLL
jgi:hypothetical protein